ncbi:MAG: hypothetical protein IPG92_04170 [Flavobacteriales bacterium]|nr:hypothetical protein [Flavobacteriales bacterium]
MTCDSDDYYNSEQARERHLPAQVPRGRKQHIGFFNTGAYQDSLGASGGIQHCLIPKPKHVLDRAADGISWIGSSLKNKAVNV